MKKTKTLLLAACLAAAAFIPVGCASYKGLIPDKDVNMKGFSGTLTTPWGTQTIKIDEIVTAVKPGTAAAATASK